MKTFFLVCSFFFILGSSVTISENRVRRQFWPQRPNPVWFDRVPTNNFFENSNNPWENRFDQFPNIHFQNSREKDYLENNENNNWIDPVERTTTSTPGTTKTIHLAPEKCNCLFTPQFNPVCGSDGNTYKNAGLLKCFNQCGVNVFQRRMGSC